MTPQEAYDYVAGIIPDFQQKGVTLFAQLHAASILSGNLVASGQDTFEIGVIISEINDDISQWQSITDKLQPILSIFGYSGLGIDPVTLATSAAILISISALLIAFYSTNKIDQHSEALKVIASHVNLSPSEQSVVDKATTPTSFFGGLFSGLGSIGTYILIGGAIYLLMYFNKD